MKNHSIIHSIFALFVLVAFAACNRSPAAKAENDLHSANKKALKEYYDAQVKIAENADKGLISAIEAERKAALAAEEARHDGAEARIDHSKETAQAQAEVAEAQARARDAQGKAAAAAASAAPSKTTLVAPPADTNN